MTHVATGSLYGLANATQPTVALAQAIKPNTFVQMPAGGQQQPTGDISVVAPTAVSVGAKLVNRLSDYYAGWPYQFSWSTWTPFINSQIAAMKASSYYSSITVVRAVERVGQHVAVGQRHLRGVLDHDLPAGPIARRDEADPGPQLLGQHQRHAELPAERRRDEHRAGHSCLARTGDLVEDRR